MSLAASCPRCPSPTLERDGGWRCPDHGEVTPLWRPAVADYDSFAEHLQRSAGFPTLMPWPLSSGWEITGFGCVAVPGEAARASTLSCAGRSELDGMVEITLVEEEPGVGLGARCAEVVHVDPGAEVGQGPPQVKVRVDNRPIALWSVSTSDSGAELERSVFAGEAHGRWLWLVLRPASAALLLRDEWILLDVASTGPELIEIPFGGSPPGW